METKGIFKIAFKKSGVMNEIYVSNLDIKPCLLIYQLYLLMFSILSWFYPFSLFLHDLLPYSSTMQISFSYVQVCHLKKLTKLVHDNFTLKCGHTANFAFNQLRRNVDTIFI